jgi:hypothetical protein
MCGWSVLRKHIYLPVVIHDFYVYGVVTFPTKYNAPLVVDPQAPVCGPVATQFLEAIARWSAEELEGRGRVDLVK